jgi:hypothetical protein
MVSNLARCGLPAVRTCTAPRTLIPAPCSWVSSGYSWARQGPPVSAGPTWKALGDAAMIEKFPPPRVTIRRYAASRVCDVVVVVRGQEMVIRCPSYSHGLKWARLERKSYKIPEPITDFPDDEEPGDVPLFCAQIEIETAPDLPDDYNRQLPTAYRLTAHRQGFAKIYVEGLQWSRCISPNVRSLSPHAALICFNIGL